MWSSQRAGLFSGYIHMEIWKDSFRIFFCLCSGYIHMQLLNFERPQDPCYNHMYCHDDCVCFSPIVHTDICVHTCWTTNVTCLLQSQEISRWHERKTSAWKEYISKADLLSPVSQSRQAIVRVVHLLPQTLMTANINSHCSNVLCSQTTWQLLVSSPWWTFAHMYWGLGSIAGCVVGQS